MPFARRIPSLELESQSQSSGVFRSGEYDLGLERVDSFGPPVIDSLQPGFSPAFSPAAELEEVFDEPVYNEYGELEEVYDQLPDVPSLMPTPSQMSMQAVRISIPQAPPPPSVREASVLESSSFSDDDDTSLDIPLELKNEPAKPAPISAARPSIEVDRTSVPGRVSTTSMGNFTGNRPNPNAHPAIDPRPGIVAFAGFGIAPEGWKGTPAYAMRVISRKLVLRDDLRIARLRRLPDVGLYEAALKCADEGAVTRGIAILVGAAAGGLGTIAAVAAAFL